MSTTQEILEIIIQGTDKASGEFDEASIALEKLGGIGKGILTVGMAAATTAVAALGTGLGIALNEAMDAQAGITQLESVLASTGGAAGVTKEQALDLADSLSQVTRFSDDSVLAAENLLLTFTNIGEDVFPRATETLLDMATAMGTDAKSGAIQLGKALNDPVAGITALTRVGVTFTDSQKKAIAAMVEMGDVAGAQTIILDELQKEFGGSAEAAGSTLAGQIDIAKNSLLNMAEGVGNELLPILQDFAEEAIPVLIDGLSVMTESHLPAFIELVGKSADVLLTAFEAGMLLVTWTERLDLAMEEQETRLITTTASYAEYQAGMQAAAAAMGEQVVFTDELTAAQAETMDVVVGLTEKEYLQEKQVTALTAIYEAAGVTTYTWKQAQEEAAIAVTGLSTQSGLLQDALIKLATEGIDPAAAAAKLLKEGIDLASDSMVEAERVSLVLAIAEKMRQINTEDLTAAEKEQLSKELELLLNQQTEIENMDKINELLRAGQIDRYDWIQVMADGIVTQEEINDLLGVERDELIEVNRQITTMPAYKKFTLDVEVTGDQLPNVGGYGGGIPTGPTVPIAGLTAGGIPTVFPETQPAIVDLLGSMLAARDAMYGGVENERIRTLGGRGGGDGGTQTKGNSYHLHITTTAGIENILDDFAMLQALAAG